MTTLGVGIGVKEGSGRGGGPLESPQLLDVFQNPALRLSEQKTFTHLKESFRDYLFCQFVGKLLFHLQFEGQVITKSVVICFERNFSWLDN